MHAKLKSFKQFTELAWADVFKLQAYHSTTSPSGQFPCRILFSRCVSQKSCALLTIFFLLSLFLLRQKRLIS